MKHIDLTEIQTLGKGTLRGHCVENILERYYGRGAWMTSLNGATATIVRNGSAVDTVIVDACYNLRSRYGLEVW